MKIYNFMTFSGHKSILFSHTFYPIKKTIHGDPIIVFPRKGIKILTF